LNLGSTVVIKGYALLAGLQDSFQNLTESEFMARAKEMKYKEVSEKSFKIVDTKGEDSSQGRYSISRSISNVNNTKTFAVICSVRILSQYNSPIRAAGS
jgi:hypothetical protein